MFYSPIIQKEETPFVEYVPNPPQAGQFLNGDPDRPRVTRVQTDGDSTLTTPSAMLHRGPSYFGQPSMHVETFYRRL